MTDRITGLLSRIPGYDGYRDKEHRRDEDRRLREAIAESLADVVESLTGASAALANTRQLTFISRIEALIAGTRSLADRVRSASYGYGGIFSERSVDELALEQIRQFDLGFQNNIATLESLASRFSPGKPPLEVDIGEFESQLSTLNSMFDARSKVVDTAQPSRDANVLAMLDPERPPTLSPLSGLKVGDTLSILGDNFQVDATITIADAGSTFTLARIDATSHTWLASSNDASIVSARVTEQVGANPASDTLMQAATITVVTNGQASTPVPAAYAVTTNDGTAVGIAFQIGDAYRRFEGNAVDQLDVEIFGNAIRQGEK